MYRRAYEMLGGEKNDYQNSASPMSIINILRRGLTNEMLEKAAQLLGIELTRLSELIGLNTHSYRRRLHGENYRLPAKQSEHTLMIIDVFAQAERYFDERELVLKWLNEPNIAFGDAPPFSLLDTVTGIKTLSETLTRMEHGMTA